MLIAAAAVAGGFFFLFDLMREREARVHEVKQTLASYEQNKKIFAQENQKLQNLNARIALLESKRITEATVPNLLSSFEAMAQKRGLSISITSVQTPLIDGEKRLYVDFSSSGDFQSISAFVDDILSEAYQVHFKKLALYQETTVEGSTAAPWQMLASLEVISFSK